MTALCTKVTFQQAPYTNSVEFMHYLYAAIPVLLQYLVTDMLENIMLYENKTTHAGYEELKDGKYKVALTVNAKKLYADSLGVESDAHQMNDWVDVAVLGRKKVDGHWQDALLYLKKHRLKAGENRL